MVPPAIGLRFRDTTVGIDTIYEHQRILADRNEVWWGWWKKDFEQHHDEILSQIPNKISVLLIDRSTHRAYLALSTERLIKSDQKPDLSLVPAYYHEVADQVFGWFLLKSIETLAYDEEIGNSFGDGTFVHLRSEPAPNATYAARHTQIDRSSLLILSDLHFGPDYEFRRQGQISGVGFEKFTLSECLLEDLRRTGLQKDIAAILITGDFTSYGAWDDNTLQDVVSELYKLRDILELPKDSLLALPGNHDVVRYPEGQPVDIATLAVKNQVAFEHERGFRFFLSMLSNRDVKEPLEFIRRFSLSNADLVVGLLNSCRILPTKWTEYGFVGPNGIEIIKKMGNESSTRPIFRLLAIHHHLLPVYKVEVPKQNGVTLSLDACEILEGAQAAGVQIAVHGHQHMPHLAYYQSLPLMGETAKPPLIVLSNGSAGVSSSRRPGEERNTYCVLTFPRDQVYLRMREIRSDAKPGAELFNGSLAVRPA